MNVCIKKQLGKLGRELPDGIVAFNFYLYEGSKNTYDTKLIGSDEFDENNED